MRAKLSFTHIISIFRELFKPKLALNQKPIFRLFSPMMLLWATTVAVLFFPYLYQKGLFLDGRLYAAISRNLGQGIGSIWEPFYSYFDPGGFIDHPPLFFWVEGLWFWLIGDHVFTEKIFSLGCFLLSSAILLAYSKRMLGKKMILFPLLLWTVTPVVFWTFRNNMLEMLLTIFLIPSFSILHRRYTVQARKSDLFIVTLLFMVTFLTKGPIAFGIFGLPLCFLPLSTRRIAVLKDILALCALSGLALLLLLSYEPARFNLSRWFDAQIVGVFSGAREIEFTSRRFKIFGDVVQQLLVPISMCLLLAIGTKKKPRFLRAQLPFLLAGIVLSMPFLVTQKQHHYYIVPALVFYSIWLAKVNENAWLVALDFINHRAKKWVYGLCIVASTGAIILSVLNSNTYSRNATMQKDLEQISPLVAEEPWVGLTKELHYNWAIHAYAMRYHHLSLIPNTTLPYLISQAEKEKGFKRINLPTQRFHLFKKLP